MCIPVHSPWLPGYTDIMQTVLVILTMAGLFPDRLCILIPYPATLNKGLQGSGQSVWVMCSNWNQGKLAYGHKVEEGWEPRGQLMCSYQRKWGWALGGQKQQIPIVEGILRE